MVYGLRELESMILRHRHGGRNSWGSSWELISWSKSRRQRDECWKWWESFETSKLVQWHTPPTRPHLMIIHEQPHPLGTMCLTNPFIGVILIHTTTPGTQYQLWIAFHGVWSNWEVVGYSWNGQGTIKPTSLSRVIACWDHWGLFCPIVWIASSDMTKASQQRGGFLLEGFVQSCWDATSAFKASFWMQNSQECEVG